MHYYKIILIFIITIFTSCEDEYDSWKIPIGYKNYEISLGDNFLQVEEEIGQLKLDVNSKNDDSVKNYFSICPQVKIANWKLNPTIFLRFNNDELVIFEIAYLIDNISGQIDFEDLIQKLKVKELTNIGKLTSKKSIVNNEEL